MLTRLLLLQVSIALRRTVELLLLLLVLLLLLLRRRRIPVSKSVTVPEILLRRSVETAPVEILRRSSLRRESVSRRSLRLMVCGRLLLLLLLFLRLRLFRSWSGLYVHQQTLHKCDGRQMSATYAATTTQVRGS